MLNAVATSTVEEGGIPEDLFSVSGSYPNPTGGMVGVDVTTLRPDLIRYSLYDLLGRRVASGERDGRVGTTHLRFDLEGQAPGLYFAHIRSGAWSRTVRVVKGRLAATHTQPAGGKGLQQRLMEREPRTRRLDSGQEAGTLCVTYPGFFGKIQSASAVAGTALQLSLTPIPEEEDPEESEPEGIGGLEL